MDRYGADYGWSPRGRYGGEYEQWGRPDRYDRNFGFRGSRAGSFYDRDFGGYEPRHFGGRYGRDFGPETMGQWNRPRYDRPRYDRAFTGRGPGMGGQGARDEWQQREQHMMQERGYPSPWDSMHPGQNYAYGLGFGQGRGRYIYK